MRLSEKERGNILRATATFNSEHLNALIGHHLEMMPSAKNITGQVDTYLHSSTSVGTREDVIQSYKKTTHQLLLLGESGSGKTVTLLQLAQRFLRDTHIDQNNGIPVYLHLSSWNSVFPSLKEWVLNELHNSYFSLPLDKAESWIESEKIILLLDGLDELSEIGQIQCLRAIEVYQIAHAQVPLIISHSTLNTVLLEANTFDQIVILESLSLEQIALTLTSAHSTEYVGLWETIKANEAIAHLAQIPLFLVLLCTLFVNVSSNEIAFPHLENEALRRYIGGLYINKQLDSIAIPSRKPLLFSLSWLSNVLERVHQKHYYLETIQPSIFTPLRDVRIAMGVSYFTGSLLVIGSIAGFHYGVMKGVFIGSLIGCFFAFMTMFVFGTSALPNSYDYPHIRNIPRISESIKRGSFGAVFSFLIFGLSLGLLKGTVLGLLIGFLLGWWDVFNHSIMVILLVIKGEIPFNFEKMLNVAVKKGLLFKIGNGYCFYHKYISNSWKDKGTSK